MTIYHFISAIFLLWRLLIFFLSDHRFITDELKDRPKQLSQESSHLHITVRSNVRESPSKASSTLKIETSPDSSRPYATTLPRSSSQQPSQTSPHYTSKVSHFVNNAHSSPNYNTQQSHQVSSSTLNKKQTSEPGRRHFFPDHSSHSSQSNKETDSLQSLKQKYSSSASTTSGTPILSPTPKEYRRSTSKVLVSRSFISGTNTWFHLFKSISFGK